MNTSDTERKQDTESATHDENGRYEALYDRFAERARELFDAGQEKTNEAMEKAMEGARCQGRSESRLNLAVWK